MTGKKKVQRFLYGRESYLIRGACYEVWNHLRGVFKERAVDSALRREFTLRGLATEAQKRILLSYKGERIGMYVPDFVIEDKVLIELKAKSYLTKDDERQFWYYLRGSPYKLGFLVNFGPSRLEIRRRVYDKARARYSA